MQVNNIIKTGGGKNGRGSDAILHKGTAASQLVTRNHSRGGRDLGHQSE